MSIIYKKNHLAFLLAIAMFLLVIFGPKFALAQVDYVPNGLEQSPITRGLCNVFEMASGNVGKSIAIFAIVACGFGFFSGKFSIALVIGITLGIGILFGAPKIIAALTGGDAVDCGTITSGDTDKCPVPVLGQFSIAGVTVLTNTQNNSVTLRSGDQDVLFIGCRKEGSITKLFVEPKVSSADARTTKLLDVLGTIVVTGGTPASTYSSLVFPSQNTKLDIADVTASTTVISFPGTGYICPAIKSVTSATWSTSCSGGTQVIAASFSTTAYKACATIVNFANNSLVGSSNELSTHAYSSALGNDKVSFSVANPGLPGDIRKHTIVTGKFLILTCGTGSIWTLTKTASATDVLPAGESLIF